MTPCWSVPSYTKCDKLYGDLRGYFRTDGSFANADAVLRLFSAEIDRKTLITTMPNWTASDTHSFVYPRHGLSRAIVDSLVAAGYTGARASGLDFRQYSDFANPPANSWAGGISLFRVPVALNTADVFGDHSTSLPVHFTYEQFRASAMPHVLAYKESGGILAMMTHHLGDDEHCHSDTW